MTDFIEWDGTETTLENLLLWWGTRKPFVHSDDCDGDLRTLHCCSGKPDRVLDRFALSSHTQWPSQELPLFFHVDGVETEVEKGDRIYYREFVGFYLIKKFDMPVYDNPQDSFVINDRGVCFSSSEWKLPEGMWEPWDLTGNTVKLCGHEVKVKGVEAFCSMRSPTSPYRHSFCLMVDFETARLLQ